MRGAADATARARVGDGRDAGGSVGTYRRRMFGARLRAVTAAPLRVARLDTIRIRRAGFSTSVARQHAYYRLTASDLETFRRDGFLVVRNFLSTEEVDVVREALETDESLTNQQIHLNDQNEGKTKLALWSNPGDGTLGSLTRSRRVVETVEKMLGGPVLHYHSKNLVKYPEEGGVWNWHQVCGLILL